MLVVVCAASVSSCTSRDSTTTTAPPPTSAGVANLAGVRLHVTLSQYRVDEGTHKVNAQVTNNGAQPVTVTSVALASPVISGVPSATGDTAFSPGQTIDLQMTYGVPDCHVAQSGPARVELGLLDGSHVSLELDRPGQALLNRLSTRECNLSQLSDVARISFGSDFSRVRVGGEPYLRGEILVVRPDGPATRRVPLTVESLAGSVLLALLPRHGGALPQTLPAGARSIHIPILIGTSNRCDAHARAGSTQTFLLSVYVHVDGMATQRVILVPDMAAQRQALAVVDVACRSSEN